MNVFNILFCLGYFILALRAEEECDQTKLDNGIQFQCSNGKCTRATGRCNVLFDCGDRSDEIGCECTKEQFQCKEENRCIWKDHQCNGYEDCNDGSDEPGICTLLNDLKDEVVKIKREAGHCLRGTHTYKTYTYKRDNTNEGKIESERIKFLPSFSKVPVVHVSIAGFNRKEVSLKEFSGYDLRKDGLLYRFFGADRYSSWLTAQRICDSEGATLATGRSRRSFDEIRKHYGNHRMWIGVTDMNHENKFEYADGGPVSYKMFLAGQPSNSGGNEHCVEANTDKNQPGYWNDNNCDVKQSFLCQKHPSSTYLALLKKNGWGINVSASEVDKSGFKANFQGHNTDFSSITIDWMACT